MCLYVDFHVSTQVVFVCWCTNCFRVFYRFVRIYIHDFVLFAFHRMRIPVQTKQHANVPDFLRAIKMLRQMRVVAAQLYSEVHVMALDEDKPLPVSDLEGNEATLASLEQSLQVHRAELTAIRQRHPLLSFLLLPQVLRLLEVVQACQNMYVATDGDALVEIPPETRQEMLMFLAYCGLDAARVVMTRDCFGASPFHEDKIELAHIERLGSWLEVLLKMFSTLYIVLSLRAPVSIAHNIIINIVCMVV